jgi:hypothetical protein
MGFNSLVSDLLIFFREENKGYREFEYERLKMELWGMVIEEHESPAL